jgi:hypothetical protein
LFFGAIRRRRTRNVDPLQVRRNEIAPNKETKNSLDTYWTRH